MDYAQAINEKEVAERDALREEFKGQKEILTRIDSALERGRARWKPQVAAIFGRPYAEKLTGALKKEI